MLRDVRFRVAVARAARSRSLTESSKPPPRPASPREARDTLAPSSFGNLGSPPPPAPSDFGARSGRAPLSTLGELESASATATLRPPGAVPPPPRALPTTAPSPTEPLVQRAPSAELETTLDASLHPSMNAAQAALIERTRPAEGGEPSAVPAPGLYIADEPLEPRPQSAPPSAPDAEVTRLRAGLLVVGGLLLMAAGALVVLIFRRAEATANRRERAAASASVSRPSPPSCALLAPPSRISPVERSVQVLAHARADGDVLLGFADAKTSATTYLYRASTGDAERLQTSPGTADVTHVYPADPPVVTRSGADFLFGQALEPGLELGVGPNGILRRGSDGATGVVWPLAAGARLTQPRVAALSGAYFVTLRQGGAEGRIMAGWLKKDGSAASELTAVEGLPRSVGTPTTVPFGEGALLLVSARADKTERYQVYALPAVAGRAPGPARALDAPGEGGGSIAPSFGALGTGRYVLQWTDGSIGQYQVHSRLLDEHLNPLSPPLRVSAKGANAGQGVVTTTSRGAVSFFIQTTAGHDELWGAPLSCQ